MRFKLACLTLIFFCAIGIAYSQCPTTGFIQATGTNCVGTQLRFSQTSSITRIDWYKNGLPVYSELATSAGTAGITVAGGNGVGPAPNQLTAYKFYMDSIGNIYGADDGFHRIQKWAPGATTGATVAGGNGLGAAANQFHYPSCVFVNETGAVYVGDNGNYRVQKWLPGATSSITVAGGNGGGEAANQLATTISIYVDKQGAIYIADLTAERIQKWMPGATSGITVAGGNGRGSAANQLSGPTDIFVTPQGVLYIADAGNSRVQKWLPGATSGVTVAGGNGAGAGANQFNGVSGVFIDSIGTLYASDASNHRVQKWLTGATAGITVAGGNGRGSAANQLSYPNDVHVDKEGNIYIVDHQNWRIQKWSQSTTITGTYTPQTTGLYKAIATNTAGCILESNEIHINATVIPSISISATQDVICSGDSVHFSATALQGGSAPQYQWKINGINVGMNAPSFTTDPLSDNAVVTCELTSNESCVSGSTIQSNTLQISVRPRLSSTIQISASKSFACSGDTVQFTATTSNEGMAPHFQWYLNNTPTGSDSPVFLTNSLRNGDSLYCILQSNAPCFVNAFASSNRVTLPVSSTKPSITLSASDTTICEGEAVNFTTTVSSASGTINYQWVVNGTVAAGVGSASFLLPNVVGQSAVQCKVLESTGCSGYSNLVTIIAFPNPTVAFSSDYTSYPSQGVVLQPIVTGNISSFSWSPAEGLNQASIKAPVANPTQNARYSLSVVSIDGCNASGSVWVRLVKGIYIPSAFTPNNDRNNDVFFVNGGKPGDLIRELIVFNRWGGKVFQVQNAPLNDPNHGWNGKSKGQMVTPGTYAYLATIVDSQGKVSFFKGTVTLIR